MANNSVREANLICHPATPPFMADHIDVSIEASDDGRLKVRYELQGDTETLMLPLVDEPARRDRLWQTTCFELFIRRPEGDSYLEYNFSPSTEWALYRFAAYRDGMADEMILDVADSGEVIERPIALPTRLASGAVLQLRAMYPLII